MVGRRSPDARLGAALALVFVVWPLTLAGATFPLRWHWSNPTPHGNDIIAMAYGNGTYVEVTERGQVYFSDDLALWTPADTGVTNTLQAVTYFGGRLIVTGENGLVLYADSPDRIQAVDLGTTNWLEGVAASAHLAVAVGDNAAVYTSPDGAAWQRQPQTFTAWLRSVAYGNGLFVTVGEGGFVATSSDGTNWNERASGVTTNDLNLVAWITNHFWAVGEAGVVLTSQGGTNWSSLNGSGATNALYSVAGNGNSTLAVGAQEVRLLSGQTWANELDPSQTPTPAPGWTYYTALWDGAAYLIGGRSGMLVQGIQTNQTARWQTPSDPVRNWLWDVTSTPGFYTAVGDHGTVMTSDDGLNWDLELVPKAATNSILLGVGGTTNLLVAVGNAGTVIYSPNVAQIVTNTNPDGTTTTSTGSAFGVLWYTPASSLPTNQDLQGVAALGNQIVVTGGNGTILTSTNGGQWTVGSSGFTNFLSSVAAFPGGLVAVGDSGTILTSTNAVTWTRRSVATTDWVYRVRYLDGRLVAVGQNGLVLTSTNGVAWAASLPVTDHWLNDVAYLGGTYLAVGNQGTVLTSPGAANWTNVGTITEESLFGLATNAGQLITVGVEGVILRSQIIPVLTPVNVLEFGRVSGENLFLFSGALDQRFTLDGTLDLANWVTGPVLEFYDASGTLLYLQASNAVPTEFFRATLSP